MKAHVGDFVRIDSINEFIKVVGIRTIYHPTPSEVYETENGMFAFEYELTSGDVISEEEHQGLFSGVNHV